MNQAAADKCESAAVAELTRCCCSTALMLCDSFPLILLRESDQSPDVLLRLLLLAALQQIRLQHRQHEWEQHIADKGCSRDGEQKENK
jgi:hypothetical protein